MCVRSLMGNEVVAEPVAPTIDMKRPSDRKTGNRMTRVKEKYIKLHEKMLNSERDELVRRQQEQMCYVPDLADGILAVSTAYYSLLLEKLAEYCEIARHSKVFK